MEKPPSLFWKPGQSKPGADVTIDRRGNGSFCSGEFLPYNSNLSLSMQQQKQRLPVFKYRNHILYAAEKYQSVVISGATGSGKSTQIPQYLYESGWSAKGKSICVTQPRRVAATTLAERVAEEMGTFVGQTVGFSIRFEDYTCEDTRIRFMTDGFLIREMMKDPLLTKYSVVMLDEVHERTINTDMIITLLKKIMKKRPELRVIIASATLNVTEYKEFFNMNKTEDTSIALSVEGRSFPVSVFYSQSPLPNYLKSCFDTVIKIHEEEPNGDILVFLSGQDEVETLLHMAKEYVARENSQKSQKLLPLPLYGGLPMQQQLKVFQKSSNARKVVFSTNVAEASVTINGIVYVVDSGFVKLRVYDASSGLDSLVITPTSKSSAAQRSGRAGRVRAGKVFRLYPESEFEKLPEFTVPEIQRTNLSYTILQLKSLGVSNILRLSFLSKPPAELIVQGLQLLYALEAIDEKSNLTKPLGVQMAEFPVNPMLSKMLLCSSTFQCSEEACTLAAMLQVENVFISLPNKKKEAALAKLKFSVYEGDHLTLINVYRAFLENGKNKKWCHLNYLNYKTLCRVEKMRNQFVALLKRFDVEMISCGSDDEMIRKCILTGFFANVAKYHPCGEYRTIRNNHPLHIHPTSVLSTERKPPKLVVFHEILCTSKDYMRDVTVVNLPWLLDVAPSYYEYGTDFELAQKRQFTEQN